MTTTEPDAPIVPRERQVNGVRMKDRVESGICEAYGCFTKVNKAENALCSAHRRQASGRRVSLPNTLANIMRLFASGHKVLTTYPGEILTDEGVTHERLDTLETMGMVEPVSLPGARWGYALTDRGEDVLATLVGLAQPRPARLLPDGEEPTNRSTTGTARTKGGSKGASGGRQRNAQTQDTYNKARAMLESGDYAVEEIAAQCGRSASWVYYIISDLKKEGVTLPSRRSLRGQAGNEVADALHQAAIREREQKARERRVAEEMARELLAGGDTPTGQIADQCGRSVRWVNNLAGKMRKEGIVLPERPIIRRARKVKPDSAKRGAKPKGYRQQTSAQPAPAVDPEPRQKYPWRGWATGEEYYIIPEQWDVKQSAFRAALGVWCNANGYSYRSRIEALGDQEVITFSIASR